MRNGNLSRITSPLHFVSSSYPTYEEWKLFLFFLFLFHSFVLILPMRNGNYGSFKNIHEPYQGVLILPMRNGNVYMETILLTQILVLILPMRNGNRDMELEIQIQILVLILPMRNGNSCILDFFSIDSPPVLILPMRNGNPIMKEI